LKLIDCLLSATYKADTRLTISFRDNLDKLAPGRILMKQEIMGWQWHQLNHMQIICTSRQTDKTTPTPHHSSEI